MKKEFDIKRKVNKLREKKQSLSLIKYRYVE